MPSTLLTSAISLSLGYVQSLISAFLHYFMKLGMQFAMTALLAHDRTNYHSMTVNEHIQDKKNTNMRSAESSKCYFLDEHCIFIKYFNIVWCNKMAFVSTLAL